MTNCSKKICSGLLALCSTLFVTAQDKPAIPPPNGAMPTAAAAPKPGPKPYKEVITDKAKTTKGFFTIHKIEDKYYCEIPPGLLSRDILMVNRVSKSSVESPKAFNE